MTLAKTEMAPVTHSTESDTAQIKIAQLSDLELLLIGGGMGDVQQ